MVAFLVSAGGNNCGNCAGDAPYPATGFDSSSQDPPQAGFGATSTSGSRADPRGRGPPCVMQANRAPVPMVVSPRPERAGQGCRARRLTGLAGPDYDATISFGLPFEPGDSQYGEYRLKSTANLPPCFYFRESDFLHWPTDKSNGSCTRSS